MAFKMKGFPKTTGIGSLQADKKKPTDFGNPFIGMDVDELDHRRGAILDYIDEGSPVSAKQRRDLELIQKAMELDPSNK